MARRSGMSFQVPMNWIASGLNDVATIARLPFGNANQKEGWGKAARRDPTQVQSLSHKYFDPTQVCCMSPQVSCKFMPPKSASLCHLNLLVYVALTTSL
jgi:hypothetical protein